MSTAKKLMKSGEKAGKKVLSTDAGQNVVGAVVDTLEKLVVEKADDVAVQVKTKAAKAGGRRPPKSTTARKKTAGRKKTSAVKKTTAGKPANRTKAARKKTAGRKPAARKKTAGRKPAAKKTAGSQRRQEDGGAEAGGAEEDCRQETKESVRRRANVSRS